jgi:6,7-dimethyl-8-ribityllumazine synthase
MKENEAFRSCGRAFRLLWDSVMLKGSGAMTKSPKFAFIKARWHADIVDQALVGFEARLGELGCHASVDTFDVPGAFEMPLLAQKLAQSGGYDVIAAAALVVDGGIYRHDFVAQAVVSGLMEVGLKTGVPVLSVSLTPHNFQPKSEHEDFFRAHFVTKGREAADAAVEILKAHAKVPAAPRMVAA